ncbi:integrin alpha-PS3-like [Drosophila biarmipes]|uniref:integrin alpha-PS3-like n=1 Tax=Drosophila biarmipes TaxID=125945 RepID=UPI0007E76ACD|nr:integrin alpha-PS3-like [Drosophila biarmipes]XP_050743169.1 integrin alpha-PS3-like [Drosophila biarmipes]
MRRLLLLAFFTFQSQIDAFNFSPYPNLVMNSPKPIRSRYNQTRSSYFGFSLVIRPQSIIVGAPRAQPTLKSQRSINEPGAIYRCSLENAICNPYVVDSQGNVGTPSNGATMNSEGKDFQWLGGSMDGGTRDTDLLLVCAPRFYAFKNEEGHLHGICYWVNNTTNGSPENVTRVSPFRSESNQMYPNRAGRYYFFMGELGLSAHVADDNSQFLIGAPGVYNWKGAVHLHKNNEDSLIRKTSLDENSYLGYAVSSGYFDSDSPNTLYYVATAPKEHMHSAVAYIFEDQRYIYPSQTLSGDQFGEYFGYSVLAEDLNGDGLTDVIISAPLNDLGNSCDNGVIYVFINKGSFEFDRTTVVSPAGSGARFGTTLSRLGDINHDGYNDVAVGAPFGGNGSVFIYLGSENGLRNTPSQRLEAPSQSLSEYGEHMFGHGLSRGSDIDGNGFNDFAIGAPNADTVYLYRSYPVVRIHATLSSESRNIQPKQEQVFFTACYRLSTVAKDLQPQELNIRISMDMRATFTENQSSKMIFKANAGLVEQCRIFEIQVIRKSVRTPIELEMNYELAKKVPQSGEFCESCATVDPADLNSFTQKLVFSTGCANEVCVVDLQLKSEDFGPTYVLGSTATLRLKYEITNYGETAFLPQFNVTSSAHLPFAQIPGNCKVDESVMTCDLNHGQPLAKGDTDSVSISFDVSQLGGQWLIISAAVFSEGNEKNSADNKQTNKINLRELTELDVSGVQKSNQVDLDDSRNSVEIINSYEIKSNGPSTVDQLTASFYLPVAYKKADSTEVQNIINISSLKILATHDSQLLPIKFYDYNNKPLVLNTTENSTQNEQKEDDQIVRSPTRRRRNPKEPAASLRQHALVETHDLPTNRATVFSCQDINRTICVRAEMIVQLRPDRAISLNVSFRVDLSEVVGSWEYFVLSTDLELLKKGDPTSSSLVINKNIKPNVIFRHLKAEPPTWYIIWSLLSGFLLLSAITYSLYKLGFFKRTKRDELNRLIRQSVKVEIPVEIEEENTSSDTDDLPDQQILE